MSVGVPVHAITDGPHSSAMTVEQEYQYMVGMISSSHGLVAEITRASLGVGYEISLAQHHSIPVLCLRRLPPGPVTRGSAMIVGNPWVTLVEYTTLPQAFAAINRFVADLPRPVTAATAPIALNLMPVEPAHTEAIDAMEQEPESMH